MKEIGKGVYIENAYSGVTLGAVVSPQITFMIDAPPRPDDGRAWLAALRSLGTGKDRLLINLDSHADRALGNRALDSTVMAHESAAKAGKRRAPIFKAQNLESGAMWETCSGLSGIRWMHPTLFYDQAAMLSWGDTEVLLEYHPGPSPGATWVLIPEENVLFVGDAVVINQPCFLRNANIPLWLETLDLLLSKEYKNYLIVSSRGGIVPGEAIREQRRHLRDVWKRLERIAKRNGRPQATEKLVPKLLAQFKFPAKWQQLYNNRLKHGLFHYYAKHYYPNALENSD